MTRLVVLVVGLALLPQGVRARDIPSVSLPADLARVLTDYEAAREQKDARGLAALFAEYGFVLSNGAPAVRGRAAIEKHYTGQGGPLALRPRLLNGGAVNPTRSN